MARFSFHGLLSAIDIARICETEPSLFALRRRMVDHLGIPESRAAHITEAIFARALLRYGEHLIAGKSKVLDRVIELRGRLDEAYEGIIGFNARTGTGTGGMSRSALDQRLREIDQLFAELDDALEKLGQPFHASDSAPDTGDTAVLLDEIGKTAPTTERAGTVRRTTTDDITPDANNRIRIETGRYKFKRQNDGSYKKTFDYDKASVVFHIENGRYRIELFNPDNSPAGELREFGVLHTPYGRAPRLTALVQANHGYQNSTMTKLFKRYGYNGDAVPTIIMRDSRKGSPHGLVTDRQNNAKAIRNASGVTLEQIRAWTIADLRMAGTPERDIAEYLIAIDNHFMRHVYPNIPANQRKRLLGNWRPGQTP